MRYKRESAFRYTFEEPLSLSFTIKEIGGNSVTTSEGDAKIIDISPEGMKLISQLNIPENVNKPTHLLLTFALNEQEMTLEGVIVWKKERLQVYEYGIQLLIDETIQRELIDQLKIYSRKVKQGENE